MIIKRNMAIDSLTKVCDESLKLIKELIEADNATYGKGFEDGMAAQAKVQQTLRPWIEMTDEEIKDLMESYGGINPNLFMLAKHVQDKLKEKNK
jgi:hypothetical protein